MREAERKYVSNQMKAERMKALEIPMTTAISEDVPETLNALFEAAVWAVKYILSWKDPYNGCRIELPHAFASIPFFKVAAYS